MSLFRFSEFELNDQTLELRRQGLPVRMQQQPARVLAFLLKNRGNLVSRAEIQQAIWGQDTFVDFEQNLNFCIRQIRITLGDHAEKPVFIETLPRLGYRFVGSVGSGDDGVVAEKTSRSRIRIGILPVENLGGSVEDYFAIGLTEDLISALSRINPERLRVTVGPPSPGGILPREQLARLQLEFDLDYLLRASVRRSGDGVRISAQLLDLSDKSVLWSEVYDRKSADLFAVQEEVAKKVSQSLVLELLPNGNKGSRKYSRSSAAYDAYLKGRFFWHKMSPEAIQSSITYFNEALAIDPNFAPAYAGLADCYAQMGSVRVGMMKPFEALTSARHYLQRAMELDDTLAEAHCTLGLIKSWYDLDWSGAEEEFQTALRLNPGMVAALLWQSLFLAAMGRHEDAIASMQLAKEADPLSPSVNVYLGVAQVGAGHYDLGMRQMRQAIELDPHYYRSYLFLGRTLTWLGRPDEAIVEFDKGISLNARNMELQTMRGMAMVARGDRRGALTIVKDVIALESHLEPAIMLALLYAKLGDEDEMYHWLHRAAERKSVPVYICVISEEFKPYLSDLRFVEFLDTIGLPHPK